MNYQPVDPAVMAYLHRLHDEELLASWPVQPPADLLPALRSQTTAEVALPQSRIFPELAQPPQQTVVVQRFDVKAQRMAALGILLLFGGGGIDLAGHGIEAAGTGMWALAAIFVASAVSRILSPKRTGSGNVHLEINGNNNRIRL
jgi:hypothetical protein